MRRASAIRDILIGGAGLGAVGCVVWALRTLQALPNSTISALLLLLVILITATAVRIEVALVVSVLTTAAFNFFLLPPFHTFTLDDPQHWVALIVFLAVAAVASQLSAAVRRRADEAVERRDELARLFNLSRDILLMTDSREAVSALARSVASRFDLDFVALALPRAGGWQLFEGGAQTVELDSHDLDAAFTSARLSPEVDTRAGNSGGHTIMDAGGRRVRLVPLRLGAKPTGVLAAAGRPLEPGTLDALAGVVAIAIERAQFLVERQQAELTRQSEELKTALLASIGHDLRTPLTAIRVAASNIKAPWLGTEDRIEQSDLILTETERLTRLFQNILDMARIDAGAIAAETRWAHPSEIVAAAREQVAHALGEHEIHVDIDPDVPVRIDPRLTAIALGHLLENAAKYAGPHSTITVRGRVGDDGLTLVVRDHGPGIPQADLPRLFERFYRGESIRTRAPGTGMGLWIARGLLAAEGARISVANDPAGGAEFTIQVPAAIKQAETTTSPAR